MRRRIVLSSYGLFLGAKGERLVVKRGGEVLAEVPAFEVSQVVIDTRGAAVSSAAMRLMLKHGVEMLVLRGGRLAGRLSPARRGSNIHLKMRQFAIRDSEEGLSLARAFAMGKMGNQADMLKSLAKNRQGELRRRLREAARVIEGLVLEVREARGPPEAVRGRVVRLEAEAGRVYWEAISLILPEELGFRSRRKRYEGPKDPFNVLLNYLYSILMSEAWFFLEVAGLEPYLGFLHVPSNRRPALAADLMEEFRQPVVDRVALSLVDEVPGMVEGERLTGEGRSRALKAYEERMKAQVTFRNRRHTIRGHMRLQAERLASAIMGRSEYRPFRVRW